MSARELLAEPSHRPFALTATLRGGVSYDPPFGLDLAGLLAGAVRDRTRADLDAEGALVRTPLPDTTTEEPDDYTLPLAVCTGGGEDWHWAASCMSVEPSGTITEDHSFNRSTDVAWASSMATRPLPSLSPMRGTYRDARMPALVTPATHARWVGVGDPDVVLDLMKGTVTIGRRRQVGEGLVLGWSIETVTTGDWFDWAHTGSTGTLLRPVPHECATACTLTGTLEDTWYAIRPPSWHPDRAMQLVSTITEDW